MRSTRISVGVFPLHYRIVAIRPQLSKIEFQVVTDVINLASAYTILLQLTLFHLLLPPSFDCPRWITLDERVLFTFQIHVERNSQESTSLTRHYIKPNSQRETVFEETTCIHWGKESCTCCLFPMRQGRHLDLSLHMNETIFLQRRSRFTMKID